MQALGINPVLLIAQIISFTILYLILNRFLYPVIRKHLNDRRQAVSSTFADREEVKRQLEEFTKKQQLEQKKVLLETRQLLDESKKSAAQTREELLDNAREESRRLIAKAQTEISKNHAQARSEIAGYAKQLAKQTVDSLLSEKLKDQDWQQAQLSQSLHKIAAAAKTKSHA